ncbi:MAG: hypothetical protein WBO19_16300, partial [Terriglobia bacterium]
LNGRHDAKTIAIIRPNPAGSRDQCNPDRGLFSCLMPFAPHDLFMSAFSTASGFPSITVK